MIPTCRCIAHKHTSSKLAIRLGGLDHQTGGLGWENGFGDKRKSVPPLYRFFFRSLLNFLVLSKPFLLAFRPSIHESYAVRTVFAKLMGKPANCMCSKLVSRSSSSGFRVTLVQGSMDHHNAMRLPWSMCIVLTIDQQGFISFGCGVGPYPTIHPCMHALVMLLKGHACTAGVMSFGSMHHACTATASQPQLSKLCMQGFLTFLFFSLLCNYALGTKKEAQIG